MTKHTSKLRSAGCVCLEELSILSLMYPFDPICRQHVCHPGSCKEFVTLGALIAAIIKFPNPLSCPLALVALLLLRKELEAMEDTTAERVMMPNVVGGYECL
jgi:hypothetical protein